MQTRPYKGDTLKEKRRMYLHLYYNSTKGAEDERRLNVLLAELQEELQHNKRVPEHEKLYAKYFEIKETPVRGTQVMAKQGAIDAARKNFGYFALISNESMDSIKALELYRNKDLCEKTFGNLKERLNMRRMLVSSEQSLDGKLFVEFVSLIYLSYIKKRMQDYDLFKDYTMQGLLDELDIIECYKEPGKKTRFSEITKRQASLFELMGVPIPDNASL
jgi:transposase